VLCAALRMKRKMVNKTSNESTWSHYYHADHCSGVDVVDVFLGIFFRVGSNSAVATNHQVAFNGLDEGERVDLHGAPFPLSQVAAVGMSLEIAL
jgi:hypothetical protein